MSLLNVRKVERVSEFKLSLLHDLNTYVIIAMPSVGFRRNSGEWQVTRQESTEIILVFLTVLSERLLPVHQCNVLFDIPFEEPNVLADAC